MNTIGRFSSVRPGDAHWSIIVKMDAEHFDRSWQYQQWLDLEMNHHYLFSWLKNGSVIGFALFHHPPGDEMTHLLKICLLPEFRGKGEALEFWRFILFKLTELGLRSVFLEVEEGNARALGFYKKIGFSPLRLIKAYYSDGANAQSMLLTL